VTDRRTSAPLADAAVFIVGGPQTARSGDDGRYRLRGVRAGVQTIRVIRLGFASETRSVTVSSEQEITADFAIGETAVRMDEVVITATGETQRRRESGNSVSIVDVPGERLATAPTLANLLTGAAPSVNVSSSGGTIGSASRFRIRGANSLSLSNEPLLIVDGVRVNSDIGGAGTIYVGGQASGRLNDLSAADIESIEITKGPAAAALYGTAAANGVIQIRTKQGRPGPTRWTAYSESGRQENQVHFPANFGQVGKTATGGRTTFCTLDAQTAKTCTPNPDSLVSWNPLENASPFINGYRRDVGLTAAGGTEGATYYLATDVTRDQGVVATNHLQRVSLRANFSLMPSSALATRVFANVLSSRLAFPQNDNNTMGVIATGLLGGAFDNPTTRGYLGQTPQEIFAIDTRENVERFTGSTLTTWQPLGWLSVTTQAGADFVDRRNTELLGPNQVFSSQTTIDGYRTSNVAQLWAYSATGSATAARNVGANVRSSTTLGVAFEQDLVRATLASGGKLLAGTGSLQGASASFKVGESNTDNRTAGASVAQQIAWRDRLYGAVSARVDNNSAFGSGFGWIAYPAASVSWVASDESFFPRNGFASSLRLRMAYGHSGQRPRFRDATTYYNEQTVTTTLGDVPGIQIGGTGNPDLRPERSREFEAGFELGVLDDRISVDFTAYDKRTQDLLVNTPLAPSLGLTVAQWRNLGETSNRGIEMVVNGRVFETKQARLELGVTGSTNRNRLEHLGTLRNGEVLQSIGTGIQRQTDGFPLGGYWDFGYTWEDKNHDGIISRANCPGQACEIAIDSLRYLGNPLPTRELTATPQLTLFHLAQLAALVNYRGGFKLYNATSYIRCVFNNCLEAYSKDTPLDQQARNIARQLSTPSVAGYVERGDYTKLRELSLTLIMPKAWGRRVGAGDVRLTLSGRNLKTWTAYTGLDPEVNATPVASFDSSDLLTQPPLGSYSARLTMVF
jgi:TonB-linked SusC/RagA family outer membrane protein